MRTKHTLLMEIVLSVSKKENVRTSDILSGTRGTPKSAAARRKAMYLYHHHPDNAGGSWSATGRAFNRDRTSVRDAVLRAASEMGTR